MLNYHQRLCGILIIILSGIEVSFAIVHVSHDLSNDILNIFNTRRKDCGLPEFTKSELPKNYALSEKVGSAGSHYTYLHIGPDYDRTNESSPGYNKPPSNSLTIDTPAAHAFITYIRNYCDSFQKSNTDTKQGNKLVGDNVAIRSQVALSLRPDDNYSLSDELAGSGAAADVFFGENKHTTESVVFKKGGVTLANEVDAYLKLGQKPGFGNALTYYSNGTNKTLILGALGDSLEMKLQQIGKLDQGKIVNITTDLVSSLKYIHSMNLIHLDFKPDNILLQYLPSNHKNQLNILDYGVSKPYKAFVKGEWKHIIQNHEPKAATPAYATYSFCFIKPIGRREDFEQLAYMLLKLYRGSLPWDLRQFQSIIAKQLILCKEYPLEEECAGIKEIDNTIGGIQNDTIFNEMTLRGLCEGFEEIYVLLVYAIKLKYSEKPDYDGIQRLFLHFYIRRGYEFEETFSLTTEDDGLLDPEVTTVASGFVTFPTKEKLPCRTAILKFSKYFASTLNAINEILTRSKPPKSEIKNDAFLNSLAKSFAMNHNLPTGAFRDENHVTVIMDYGKEKKSFENMLGCIIEDNPSFMSSIFKTITFTKDAKPYNVRMEVTSGRFPSIGFGWNPEKTRLVVVLLNNIIVDRIRKLCPETLIQEDTKLTKLSLEFANILISKTSQSSNRKEELENLCTYEHFEFESEQAHTTEGAVRSVLATIEQMPKLLQSHVCIQLHAIEIFDSLTSGLMTRFSYACVYNFQTQVFQVVLFFRWYFWKAFQFINGMRGTMPLNLKHEVLFLVTCSNYSAKLKIEECVELTTYKLARNLCLAHQNSFILAQDELHDISFRVREGYTEIHFGEYNCHALLSQLTTNVNSQWAPLEAPRALIAAAHNLASCSTRTANLVVPPQARIVDHDMATSGLLFIEYLNQNILKIFSKAGEEKIAIDDVSEIAFGWAIAVPNTKRIKFSIMYKLFFEDALNLINLTRKRYGTEKLEIEKQYKPKDGYNVNNAKVVPLPIDAKISRSLIGAGILYYLSPIMVKVDDEKTKSAFKAFMNPKARRIAFIVLPPAHENDKWKFDVVMFCDSELTEYPLHEIESSRQKHPPYALPGNFSSATREKVNTQTIKDITKLYLPKERYQLDEEIPGIKISYQVVPNQNEEVF